jgi:predicted MFS family arabinose efflux permease
VLVQLITAPAAILIDAISFLVSAVSVGAIRTTEPPPARAESHSHPLAEASSGLAFVFRQPALRSVACWYLTAYLFFGLINPLYVLYAIRDLRLGPALLGAAVAVGGAGNMLGSALAPKVQRRFGLGRTFIGAAVALGLALEFLPLARGPVVVALGCLMAQQLFGDMAHATYYINELTLRQSLAPDHMLGRVNAAMRMMSLGMIPVGSILGGLLASLIGVRGTLAVAATGILLASGWLIFSPLRKMHSSEIPVTL